MHAKLTAEENVVCSSDGDLVLIDQADGGAAAEVFADAHTVLMREKRRDMIANSIGIQRIKRRQHWQCLHDLQRVASGLFKILDVQIAAAELIEDMIADRIAEHRDPRGSIVHIVLVQKLHDEVPRRVFLAAEVYAAIAVIRRKNARKEVRFHPTCSINCLHVHRPARKRAARPDVGLRGF